VWAALVVMEATVALATVIQELGAPAVTVATVAWVARAAAAAAARALASG